jgi:CheY-like chemotaxis protein
MIEAGHERNGYAYWSRLLMENGLPFSILVVDDDADDRMFINEAFLDIGSGADVKKFAEGSALLRYLEALGPELYPRLIVLDNTLPGMSAAELIGVLKTTAAYERIPVVVHSTLVTERKREELMRAGAIACLEKGKTVEEMRQVARMLRDLAGLESNKGPAHQESSLEA